jgi:hypothetical protein
MNRNITTKKIPAGRNRELQVAAAVAREAVVELHVSHALELIRAAAGTVPELRMLDIYIRLLELAGPTEETVANRVLAALGHTRAGSPPFGDGGADAELPADDDASLLRNVRRRLRGRVNPSLRRVVELRTGATKIALLDIHVRHATGFVQLLADTHGIEEACATYVTFVPMPAPLASVLYLLVVDRIAAEELHTPWSEGPTEPVPANGRDARLAARSQRNGQARNSA